MYVVSVSAVLLLWGRVSGTRLVIYGQHKGLTGLPSSIQQRFRFIIEFVYMHISVLVWVHLNMVFTRNKTSLVVHLSVYMILTVSRFLIICVQLGLNSSTFRLHLSTNKDCSLGSSVYMPLCPGFIIQQSYFTVSWLETPRSDWSRQRNSPAHNAM